MAPVHIPFQVTDWELISSIEEKGITGSAYSKTIDFGSVKLRQVEYSPNYEANHFCSKGHIVYCISGSFEIELSDQSLFTISADNTFQVSENGRSHKACSKSGARLLIVDGDFLK